MPFFLKCNDGYLFKILAELLQNNAKNVCFNFSSAGIIIKLMDDQSMILFDIILKSENFQIYKYNFNTPEYNIGVTIKYIYSMLKSIKKKDVIELFIKNDESTFLGVKVIPKEHNKLSILNIKTHPSQRIIYDIPDNYNDPPITISSHEFQKMIKELLLINSKINIECGDYFIKFKSIMDNIYDKEVIFGDYDEKQIKYSNVFDTEQLLKISKMTGISKNLLIYFKTGSPLMLKVVNISLGEIRVYIKPSVLVK